MHEGFKLAPPFKINKYSISLQHNGRFGYLEPSICKYCIYLTGFFLGFSNLSLYISSGCFVFSFAGEDLKEIFYLKPALGPGG